MKDQRIVYVGNKPVKKDTIGRSQTVWFGYGDTQVVSGELASKLLQFPDVWVLEEKFKSGGTLPKASRDGNPVPITREQLKALGYVLVDDPILTKDEPEQEKEQDAVRGEVVFEPIAEDLDESDEFTDSEVTKEEGDLISVQDAIKQLMNEGDKDKFSDTGKPKIDAVRALAGQNIGVKDVNKAWTEITGN